MGYWDSLTNWYTLKGSYLSVRNAIIFLLVALAISISGYMIIEGYSFPEALYMTSLTISTVGFSEVRPLSNHGQMFTTALIFLNFGVVAYSLSVFTGLVIEGQLFKDFHLQAITKEIKKMKNHIIVCGYGRYGRQVVEHMISHDIPFILIDRNQRKIEEIQKNENKILYVHDDATHDQALEAAKISYARALITTFPDDTDNLFTVLSARQMNPKIQIISAAQGQRTEEKLKMAGANQVILPDKLGGFFMATIISKPHAVEFFSLISEEKNSNFLFEEINYRDLDSEFQGKSIRELSIREKTGATIIGYKDPNGIFTINPHPDTMLESKCSYIVLGDVDQLTSLRKYLAYQ